MSVHVGAQMMFSHLTEHRAKAVGQGDWVVDFLPGRTLSEEQALAAVHAAEQLTALKSYAALLGLTALELVGMASVPCTWPPPDGRRSRTWQKPCRELR